MITVVSGLPRSGTSLVMQMLAAGGHPLLCDHQRSADEDNPRGYCEYEKVKSLGRDAGWLGEAEGKAVKIISFLLKSLPDGHDYRVIFLRRDLGEVLRSQAAMLNRRGEPPGPADDVMRKSFEQHLLTVDAWLARQSHIRLLNCPHAELLRDPLTLAKEISRFLGCDLNVTEMVKSVDPKLHRQKRSGPIPLQTGLTETPSSSIES